MKRDLVGGEWRMRGIGGAETGGGDGNEMGLLTKKKGGKSLTGIGASLTPDYRDKEEGNYMKPLCPMMVRNMCLDGDGVLLTGPLPRTLSHLCPTVDCLQLGERV